MEKNDFDSWADFYDIIYSKYNDDIQFYIKEIGDDDCRVLEISCGTGRVYLPLLEKGFDIWGFDISEKMLKVLKKKAENMGLKPKVFKADMRDFDLKQEFDMIIIPFKSFIHNITVEDQIKTLKCVKKHLKSDGTCIIHLLLPNPEYIIQNYDTIQSEHIYHNDKLYTLQRESSFIDEVDQIVNTKQTLIFEDEIIWKGEFKISLIYKREFELLLRIIGFKDWKLYGGFNYQPLENNNQEMIWIIKNI